MSLFLILSIPLIVAVFARLGLFYFRKIDLKAFLLGFSVITVFYIFFYIFVRDLSYFWDGKALYLNSMRMLVFPFVIIYSLCSVLKLVKTGKDTRLALFSIFYLVDNIRLLVLADTRFSYLELIIIPLLRVFLVIAFVLILEIPVKSKIPRIVIYLIPVISIILLHTIYYLFLLNRIEIAIPVLVLSLGVMLFGYKRCGVV